MSDKRGESSAARGVKPEEKRHGCQNLKEGIELKKEVQQGKEAVRGQIHEHNIEEELPKMSQAVQPDESQLLESSQSFFSTDDLLNQNINSSMDTLNTTDDYNSEISKMSIESLDSSVEGDEVVNRSTRERFDATLTSTPK